MSYLNSYLYKIIYQNKADPVTYDNTVLMFHLDYMCWTAQKVTLILPLPYFEILTDQAQMNPEKDLNGR